MTGALPKALTPTLSRARERVTPTAAGEGADPILKDSLRSGLKLVFCGTAPSAASAAAQAYYAKPGNRFWKTLHEVRLTKHQFAPKEYGDLLALKIGLTDLNKRESGVDAKLTKAGFDVPAFKQRMRMHRPRIIAFTSKTAASKFFERGTGKIDYGRQEKPFEEIELFVLPSTSGLATKYFETEHWQILADFFHRLK